MLPTLFVSESIEKEKAGPRTETIFGRTEKYYRRPVFNKKSKKKRDLQRKEDELKLRSVVNFGEIEENSHEIARYFKTYPLISSKKMALEWTKCPGLILISGYLNVKEQAFWVNRCLNDLSESPYTNLSNLNGQGFNESNSFKNCQKQPQRLCPL